MGRRLYDDFMSIARSTVRKWIIARNLKALLSLRFPDHLIACDAFCNLEQLNLLKPFTLI